MKSGLVLSLVLLLSVTAAPGATAHPLMPSLLCDAAIAVAERDNALPPGLLTAREDFAAGRIDAERGHRVGSIFAIATVASR